MLETENLEPYFTYCKFQKNLDEKTLKAYRIDLQQFTLWAKSKHSIGRAEMEEYLEKMVSQYKISTVKRKIAAVKAYYNYLVYEDLLEHSPFEKIQLHLRQELLLPRTIDRKALKAIFDAAYMELRTAESTSAHNKALRNTAVLELLFATGVRVSELCSITLDQLDLYTQVVRIRGKGSKERQIYLASPQVIDILKCYKRVRKTVQSNVNYFFLNRDGNRLSEQSVRRIINHYAEMAAQTGHYTPHMFRHSFATYLWDECGDVYEVKEILGHSSIKTTERYVHASFERQKRVLSSMHPRDSLKIQI